MSDHVTQDQLDAHTDRLIAAMTRGFERVDGHFERLNGRVRGNETDIAVLKDRADRSVRLAAWIGGVVSAVVSAIAAFAGSQR